MAKIIGWGFFLGALSASIFGVPAPAGPKLEPFSYRQNFQSGELNAWASYPLWQDTAFDPDLRPGTILPGDPNISLIQRVMPYAPADQYAGAQKEFDAYLAPGGSISLRFYLKTHLAPEFFKVRLAAGPDGAVDFTLLHPAPNSWQILRASYDDFVLENPALAGRPIKVNALAVLAKFPKADPEVPIYLGLDDVAFDGLVPASFRFSEPAVLKLAEWAPYIPARSYRRGEPLILRGEWPFEAGRVELAISPFAERAPVLLRTTLEGHGRAWSLAGYPLNLPDGLYLARLTAKDGNIELAQTDFTIHVDSAAGRAHPRLWFDSAGKTRVRTRLGQERLRSVRESLLRTAKEFRDQSPVDKYPYDIDNFPDDEPLLGNVPRSIYPWFERINAWRNGLNANTMAYALAGDAGSLPYAKALLLKLSGCPTFLHPWFEKRGQHIYYPVGELGMELALAYDLLYDELNDVERAAVRAALRRNIISGCHRSYVENNLVTSHMSNWVAHVTGGSLMAQATMAGDGPEAGPVEPYLTGALLKLRELIDRSSGRDGGYGESLGYCYFTMLSLSKALPAVENVYHVDLSGSLRLTYQDFAPAGILQDKNFFYFGDASGSMPPMTSWAWYLAKTKDPLLAGLYRALKNGDTLMDALYPTDSIPARSPFDTPLVRAFRDLGTTVFRGGFAKDDFLFVLRTGPFYNHQHLDQGSFWLADRGRIFIQERHGGTYYDDPIYRTHYIQPVAHSTILIDRNPQSQRTGDPLRFAAGFEDRAFIGSFLDGTDAAFSSGDIGRLYWGRVKGIQRNALYLKPRAVLLLDTVTPAAEDAAVTLLFQAERLADIQSGPAVSAIGASGAALRIHHLAPEKAEIRSVETPHYIGTLKTQVPLIKEGMLTATARTEGRPLVMANLLTTLEASEVSVARAAGDGPVRGKIQGTEFAFSTRPGRPYAAGPWGTDAAALAWKEDRVFAALCTSVYKNDVPKLKSEKPITCELSPGRLAFCLGEPSAASIGLAEKPLSVRLDGRPLNDFVYDAGRRELRLLLPAGEGRLTWK